MDRKFYFSTKLIWTQNFADPKIIWTHNFLTQNIFAPKFCLTYQADMMINLVHPIANIVVVVLMVLVVNYVNSVVSCG